MTKDFKQQAASDSAFSQYGMGWMLGGVAIGLLVGLALYALNGKNGTTTSITATTQTSTPPIQVMSAGMAQNGVPANNPALNTAPANQSSPEEMPGFSYHAVLPQLEVNVPMTAVQPSAPAGATKDSKTTKAPVTAKTEDKPADKKEPPAAVAKGVNGFQLGSYKTQAQASTLQGRLKKGGLNARIEPAQVNGGTVFRVRLGPATSQEMLDKWQQTLSGMGISPMAVRM